MRKIRGNTVGTTISPDRVAQRITCEDIDAVSKENIDEYVQGVLSNDGVTDHLLDKNNPHGVTCEQIGAVTEKQLNDGLNLTHGNAVSDAMQYTNEEIALQVETIYNDMYTKAEVDAAFTAKEDLAYEVTSVITSDYGAYGPITETIKIISMGACSEIAKHDMEEYGLLVCDEDDNFVRNVPTKGELATAVADGKAVIVTVNGSTPSHTSQDIYAAIQAGKVVYLHLWGNTYIICSACTESEAKFENSFVNSITGADGKSYSTQNFRLYFIKNDKYTSNTTVLPNQSYVDAQIAYYLNQ